MSCSRPLPGSSSANAAESPFHAGEQTVQERLGVRERVERMGRRMLRDSMPEDHRELFRKLPFLVVGSLDPASRVWASLLIGEPGFVKSSSARSLEVRASPLPGDPLSKNLSQGAPLAVLGIELATRRRNRANGRLVKADEAGFELSIEQSFGNCKQYIQARAGQFVSNPPGPFSAAPESARLSRRAVEVLARCDTSFIATASREPARGGVEGLDVSHRGGRPGFIRVVAADAESVITLPDFFGNFMFNSFGNLELNPRAGFLALDFEAGDVLSLTGSARVIWEGPEVDAFLGAERLLEFRVSHGQLWSGVLAGWSTPEPSPQLRETGTWQETVT